MRFGRHLKEVTVPGKEDDCVRYDALKAAIKTQLAARWGGATARDGDASESEASTSGRLEEGLLESTPEASAARRRAFYAALEVEFARLARQYDASLAQLRRKVASLMGEARRGSVLDLLQLGAEDQADADGSPASSTASRASTAAPVVLGAHREQLDRAFRHVYHDVTLARHNASLNYTGMRKIVKKFLKKTCKAIAAAGSTGGDADAALRTELADLLEVIPIPPPPRSPLADDDDASALGVGSGDDDGPGDGLPDDADPLAETRAPAACPSAPGTPGRGAPRATRRGGIHIPLPASPSRALYLASAAAAETEVRHRLRAAPFARGGELHRLADELERAYVQKLMSDSSNTNTRGGGALPPADAEEVTRVARRRLRLIERPAPLAADRLAAFAAGVSFCAFCVSAALWALPASTDASRCPRCSAYFDACVPAFRLTAMPIVWLWCWAGVTRACGAHYINYRFIMEVSLREEAGWHWNAAMAATLTAAWLVIFALFTASTRHGVDPMAAWTVGAPLAPAYYPLGLVVFCALVIVFPPASIFAAASSEGGARVRAESAPRAGFVSRLGRRLLGMLRSCERLFNPHARASLVRSIAHAATAPFGPPVRFRDNLVMDVACSLVRCLVDFETTARFFLTGEYERDRPRLYADHGATSGVITVVPYWFRLQQCVRRFYDAKRGSRERVEHVVNAGKYLVSLLGIGLASVYGFSEISLKHGGFFAHPGQVTWIAVLSIGTLYSYAWDIVMDWGLLEARFESAPAGGSGAGGFLRAVVNRCVPRVRWVTTRHRVFRSRTFYAWAMVSNLIGRFAWAVTITPRAARRGFGGGGKGGGGDRGVCFYVFLGWLDSEAAGTFAATLELLRRAQWTFLRLENEYLNNAARYRSVVAAPALLDEVSGGSGEWDSEWRFERDAREANAKTAAVYAVVFANALVALAVLGVFYLVYSR